jgi:hypothetical protein
VNAPSPTPIRRPWLTAAAAALVLLLGFGLFRATRLGSPAPVTPPVAESLPATPPVLVETSGEEGHLTIGVVSLDRVAPDTVELRLAITNTNRPASPGLDIAQRFSTDGPDRGTLAEVYLADLSHEHKFFVLRDSANAPIGSRDVTPLAAGERRVLWARYPAPGDRDVEVVVHVPHAEPLPNVPVGQKTTAP